MQLSDMQDRLDILSDQIGCRLDQAPNMDGMMYVEFGYVEGPTIEETDGHFPNAESRYMVCLHELGHMQLGHTQGRPWTDEYHSKAYGEYSDPEYWTDRQWYFNNGVLRSEAEAWNWALENCNIPSEDIAPETRDFMWNTCLGSYFNHARSVGFATPGQMLYNGDRHYVQFAYGMPDKYFLQTKRRIVEGDIKEDEKILTNSTSATANPPLTHVDWSEVLRRSDEIAYGGTNGTTPIINTYTNWTSSTTTTGY